MFPVDFVGHIDIGSISPERVDEVTARIVSVLNKAQASSVVCEGNTVSFRAGGFRRVSRWHVLVSVDRGTLTVIPGSHAVVQYDLSCVENFVLSTIVVVAALFIAAFRIAPVLVIAFGTNYIIRFFRLRAFIRDAVAI